MEDNRPIRPFTAYQGAKTLHIHPIWMWDAVSGGSQPQPWFHNIIWCNLTTPFFQKITDHPPEQVLQCKGAPICPSRVYECAQTLHMPIQSIWMCSNTSYTSNMDVGCSLGPLAASTMTPQHHLAPRYPTCTGVTVRLDPQAQPQHMNVLKHFIYLQYGCGMQFGTSCSLNHDTTTSFGSTLPHLHRHNSLRFHPCAHPQHMKVLKHFIYIYIGCWMQSAGACSLNHDTTTSFGSTLPQFNKNKFPGLHCTSMGIIVWVRLHPSPINSISRC
jgi:hypothetical protein